MPDLPARAAEMRSASRAWWISGLLLLATMLNYMDRQTLANVSVRISRQFELTEPQYGTLELAFGWAFAFGSLAFGVLVDRWSVRWLYPGVLLAWSVVGFMTGLSTGYASLLVCRTLLGFFEAGHWPCALVVTQAVLIRSDRALGNGILQSGASLGAVLTPQVIRLLVGDRQAPDLWRSPFLIIGSLGIIWIVAWLLTVGPTTIQPARSEPGENAKDSSYRGWLADILRDPRFWSLVVVITSINATWQLIRAWLPMFLQQGRDYSEKASLYFNSAYYIAADVGCLSSGAAVLWMCRRGVAADRARFTTYGACSVLAATTVVAAVLPQGWPLLLVLLVVGAGALGMFPMVYSLTQELRARHVGKATGLLAFVGWMLSSPLQALFGWLVKTTHSFDLALALSGTFPLLSLTAVLLLWHSRKDTVDCTARDVGPLLLVEEAEA